MSGEDRPLDDRVLSWLHVFREGLQERMYEAFGKRLQGDMPKLYEAFDEAMEFAACAQRGDFDDIPSGNPDPLDFLHWCGELAVLIHDARVEHGGHYRSVDHGYWKPYFDQGLSPAAALSEDMAKVLPSRNPTPPGPSEPAAPDPLTPSLPAEPAPPP